MLNVDLKFRYAAYSESMWNVECNLNKILSLCSVLHLSVAFIILQIEYLDKIGELFCFVPLIYD